MNASIVDKIYSFVAARGEKGVTSAELAGEFLFPTGTRPEVCDKLLRTVLAAEPRLVQDAEGRWVAVRPQAGAAGQMAAAYTVIETTTVQAGGRPRDVEWAAARRDNLGRGEGTEGTPIRLEPSPAGLVLPAHLRAVAKDAPAFPEAVAQAAALAAGSTIVAWRLGAFHIAVCSAVVAAGGAAPLLSLERFAKRTLGSWATSPAELAATLELPSREPADAGESARFTAELLEALLAHRDKLGLAEPEEWVGLQHPKRVEVDYSAFEFDKEYVDTLPEAPGIYILRDANGQAVYVGKAGNLRDRVRSYFRARVQRDEKTERILEATSRLDVEETGNDLAAWLAEFRAIRDLRPRINIQFDVHDRPAAARGPHKRLLLVLPAIAPDQAELFLLHGDRALGRLTLPRAEPLRAKEALERFFFGSQPPPEGTPSPGEIQIAWSWLDRHADDVNGFDVDLAGGLDGAMVLLEQYLKELPEEGRVFRV